MDRQGIALVLSAPSGTGKTTLVKMLRTEFPRLSYSISCTTRSPREGEQDGKDYHFLSREKFLQLKDEHYFAEWAEVHGNFYGTPLAPVRAMLQQGQDVLFDIDVQGARQLKQNLPEAFFAFILPPSFEELRRRLHTRGLDSEETIRQRLANAHDEMKEAVWYDALIVNDQLESAYARLCAAYKTATLAPHCQKQMLCALLEDFA